MGKLEEYIKKIAEYTDESAFIKLSSDGDLSYIRIDNNVFYQKEIENGDFIEYCRKLRKAMDIVRESEDVRKLDHDTYNFVMKYHPTWILIRESYGFNKKTDDEIWCYNEHIIKTYKDWCSDIFRVFGHDVYSNAKEDAELKRELFLKTIGITEENPLTVQENLIHPDYYAFLAVASVKEQIDNYNKESKGHKIRGVKFKLDKDRFPIVEINDKNKCTYRFDFRNRDKMEECLASLRMFSSYLTTMFSTIKKPNLSTSSIGTGKKYVNKLNFKK